MNPFSDSGLVIPEIVNGDIATVARRYERDSQLILQPRCQVAMRVKAMAVNDIEAVLAMRTQEMASVPVDAVTAGNEGCMP
jgi:hypothetical protein